MDAQTAFLLFAAVVALAFLASRLRPAGKSADRAITAAVNAALLKEEPLGTLRIDVKTFEGKVILGGTAREYEQVKRAVEIARAIPGVQSVESRISAISSG